MLRKLLVFVGGLVALLVLGTCGTVAYATMSAESRMSFPDAPMPALQASTDPAVIERGRYLVYGPGHCSQCHAPTSRTDFAGVALDAPLKGGLEFAMGPMGTTYAANLTPDPETGIGARTDGELARAIRHGVLADGRYSMFMTIAASKPSDEDLVAILSYLRSRPAVRNEVPRGETGAMLDVMTLFVNLAPASGPAPAGVLEGAEPSVDRGRYLANDVALCIGCHSPFDFATFTVTEPLGGGGSPEPSHGADSDMEFAAPNLTSDATGITGRLDEEAFVARLRHGRVYESSIMPWEGFANLSDSDARSIYRYLKTLPPVQNDVGPSYRKVGWKAGDPQ